MSDQYLTLLDDLLTRSAPKGDRTGTGTLSRFGEQLHFALDDGFPLLTTKKLPFRWIAEELFWMLSGSTNEHDLSDRGVDIWKEWATAEQCARFGRKPGDLGPVYGHQWRNFGATRGEGHPFDKRRQGGAPSGYNRDGHDQIANILATLRINPNSRRILLTGWNPKEADRVALPPCHTLVQFYVRDQMLSAQVYMRSADIFLGVPFNIASYALLTHMLAHVAGFAVGDLVVSFGDVHLYNNHVEQAALQLTRDPLLAPRLTINSAVPSDAYDIENLLAIQWEHLTLTGYEPYPTIKAEVSV